MKRLGDPLLVVKIQKFFGVQTQTNNTKPDSPKYVIGNKFWYYLFVFGTALGDEVFYSTFIPFWFWNIDGAVGRRVVLVWTLVMYIGKPPSKRLVFSYYSRNKIIKLFSCSIIQRQIICRTSY